MSDLVLPKGEMGLQMYKRMYRVRSILFSVFLYPLLSAAATTYYVDVNSGADSNSGKSVSEAKKSIQTAIDAAANGDVVSVAEGKYRENLSLSKCISLIAATPLKVVIDGNQSGRCIDISSRAAGCVVDGFVLYNGAPTNSGDKYGGGIECKGNATIRNCHFKDNGNNNLTFAGGIHTTDGANVVLYNCLLTGNTVYMSGGATFVEAASTLTLDRCTLCGNNCLSYISMGDYSVVYSNTIGGVSVHKGTVIVKGSIIWGNNGGQIGAFMPQASQEDNKRIVSYSCISGGHEGLGNIARDPEFTDVVNNDFSLQASSPCIDAGSPSETDPDGTPVDMGFSVERINSTQNPLCVITFDANGGTPTPSDIVRKVGAKYGVLPIVSRNSYAFDGWFTAADSGTRVMAWTTVNANATLYAHWVPSTGRVDLSDIEVFSGYPWQDVVIGYRISGSTDKALGGLEMSARDNVSGKIYKCETLEGVSLSSGSHIIKWNASADGAKFRSDNVVFAARIVELPLYCVIDLSAGPSATHYPVRALDSAPIGGWTDEYKTTKLVLRRVEAGTFKMMNKYDVILTKPFYIGVFEVSQRQWELVMGARPSYFGNSSCYASRPVEKVSYEMIRGCSAGAEWPENNVVEETSFLGKLRRRTGINFDLPTEAHWEYACRAETVTDYNNGINRSGLYQDSNMDVLGRYWYNGGYEGRANPSCSLSAGTAKVGSYLSNAWGLYDMHGNVGELCLDWEGTIDVATDPRGAVSGTRRVVRGGNWGGGAVDCTSSARSGTYPSDVSEFRGLRLSWAMQEDVTFSLVEGYLDTIAAAASAPVPVDTTFKNGEGGGSAISVAYGSIYGSGCCITANGAKIVDDMLGGNVNLRLTAEDVYKLVYSGVVTMETTVFAGYRISFNVMGGGVGSADIMKRSGCAYGTLPTVARNGCKFLGWFTEAVGGDRIMEDTIVDVERTLYAHWDRYCYDLGWLDGGRLDVCSGVRRTCEPQKIAMDPAWASGGVRAMVDIDGVEKAESRGSDEFVWSGDETKEYTLKHQVYDAQGRVVGEPYTVTIAWTSRAAVTFEGGNGEEAFSREYDKSYAYGELPSVTKTGHTFAGWYTAAEGGEKVEAGAQFDGGVSKLYAHWTVNQYDVKFDKNGGEGIAGDLTVAYGDVVPMDGVMFRKSGYRLAGWATAADGAAVYGQSGAMSNLTAEANGSVQLYAVWEPTTVDLKSFKQRYPWNGFVDVECEVGAEGRVGLMLVDEESGTNFTAETLFCQGGSVTNNALWMAEGLQKFIWDAGSDLPDGFKTSKLKARTYFVEGEE